MIKRTLTFAICIAIQFRSGPECARRLQRRLKPLSASWSINTSISIFKLIPPTEPRQAFISTTENWKTSPTRGVDAEVAGLLKFQKQFDSIQGDQLPEESGGDLQVLNSAIRARLLELQNIQRWRKDPDIYISNVSHSVFLIMRRNFAPPEERLRSVIAREREIPRVLEEARENIHNPPKVYTQVALQQMPDNIKFFQNDVPEAFTKVQDPKLLAEFKATTDETVKILSQYRDYLRKDLLPASHGDFRLGADNFSKKLRYDEMVDIPLDRLLEVGFADLRRNQQQFKQVAAQIDPNHSPVEVLANLRKDHPACRSVAADLPRHAGWFAAIYRTSENHHHSIDRAAHRRRDAALRARPDHCFHGYARGLR